MSSSDYIADLNARFHRDLECRSELRRVADTIEKDAAGKNGAELINTREVRVNNAIDHLYDYVDYFFFESGLDCLNNRAVRSMTRMVAEVMITQRDRSWECFEPTGRAETLAESPAEQD